jgi:hypothetical protein
MDNEKQAYDAGYQDGYISAQNEYAPQLDKALCALSLMFRRANQIVNTIDGKLIPDCYKEALNEARRVLSELVPSTPDNEKIVQS